MTGLDEALAEARATIALCEALTGAPENSAIRAKWMRIAAAIEDLRDALRSGEEVCRMLVCERDEARAEVRRLRDATGWSV